MILNTKTIQPPRDEGSQVTGPAAAPPSAPVRSLVLGPIRPQSQRLERDCSHIVFEAPNCAEHYISTCIINGVKTRVCIDSGAASTTASAGLARLLGLKVEKPSGRWFKGVEGRPIQLYGQLTKPTISFTPDFEIQLSHVDITPSESPLFLLGNDVLRWNQYFEFRGFDVERERAYLRFRDTATDRWLVIPCLEWPQPING